MYVYAMCKSDSKKKLKWIKYEANLILRYIISIISKEKERKEKKEIKNCK